MYELSILNDSQRRPQAQLDFYFTNLYLIQPYFMPIIQLMDDQSHRNAKYTHASDLTLRSTFWR